MSTVSSPGNCCNSTQENFHPLDPNRPLMFLSLPLGMMKRWPKVKCQIEICEVALDSLLDVKETEPEILEKQDSLPGSSRIN